jgi:hypothetical protein
VARKQKALPGTWIEREMFQSRAFLSLKGFAPQLLILFLSKRSIETIGGKGKERRRCTNKNSLSVTYIEREKLGITQPRATRGLDELLAKGFLEQTHAGGAYKRDRATYGLSDKWRLWTPGIIFETRKRDVRRGFQNRK